MKVDWNFVFQTKY